MKKFLIALGLALWASTASAQVIVGPSSKLQWDSDAINGLTFNLTVDTATPVALTGVTCGPSVPPVAGQQTCNILLVPQVPIGTHTLTMTAQSGPVISAPSVPFSYTTLLIPIPRSLRIVRTWHGTRYEWV